MRNLFQFDRPFRIAFLFLVGVSLVVLIWQCSQLPHGQSRVDWPAASSGKKQP